MGGGECGREGGGQDGVEWGGKWDNCNGIINKYIKKKKKSAISKPGKWQRLSSKNFISLQENDEKRNG